jgi:hypothetical protein
MTGQGVGVSDFGWGKRNCRVQRKNFMAAKIFLSLAVFRAGFLVSVETIAQRVQPVDKSVEMPHWLRWTPKPETEAT